MILLQVAPELRPLKPPLELAAPPGPPIALIVAVLAVALLAAFAVVFLVQRLRQPDPAVLAERELRRLLGQRLPEQGRVREHYAGLASVLRRYVVAAYGVPATALTPPEVVDALDGRDAALVDYLRRVL